MKQIVAVLLHQAHESAKTKAAEGKAVVTAEMIGTGIGGTGHDHLGIRGGEIVTETREAAEMREILKGIGRETQKVVIGVEEAEKTVMEITDHAIMIETVEREIGVAVVVRVEIETEI